MTAESPAAPVAAAAGGDTIDRRAMATLSTGHLGADLAQGAVPAILAFLKPKLGLSYTEVAGVVLAATVGSSVVQPLFGIFSDRRTRIWLLWSGVLVSGTGIAFTPLVPTYGLLLLLVLGSSIGVAAFHPEGMKLAGRASGMRRASGMAAFQTGGNLGFAIGPFLASSALAALGLEGGLVLLVPAVLVATLLVVQTPLLSRIGPPSAARRALDGEEQPRAFRLLMVIVGLRSLAYYGLFTFIPLWEVQQGESKAYGAHLLSAVLLCGAVGTIVGGPLADRFGKRLVLSCSMALAPPLIVVYVVVGGTIGAVAVCLAGAVIVATFGVSIVMAQSYMPRRPAMASGLSVGLAIGLGGVSAVLLGAVADSVDLRTAILLCAIGPALGSLLVWSLPGSRKRSATIS